jgi:hypothetical protein
MALFLRFTAPEAVLAAGSGEAAAWDAYRTGVTHEARLGLAPKTRLWPLGPRSEEQARSAPAGGMSHPLFVPRCFDVERLDSGHPTSGFYADEAVPPRRP